MKRNLIIFIISNIIGAVNGVFIHYYSIARIEQTNLTKINPVFNFMLLIGFPVLIYILISVGLYAIITYNPNRSISN